MPTDIETMDEMSVLRRKRNATWYEILVHIAKHQPAVSQQEIADAIELTPQAVSDNFQELVTEGFITKHGRGRYEVTKEGIDWLISQTEGLRNYIEHVSEDVIGQVEIDTAIATTAIEDGQIVTLEMRDGLLHATPGDHGEATGVAVTTAQAGADIGISDFDGILDYEFGTVTIISVPPVQDGGSAVVDSALLTRETATHDLVATAGTEAVVASDAADIDPDIRFGTSSAVQEAAMKGLDVLVIAVTSRLSSLSEDLREQKIDYEVIEATGEAVEQ